MALTLSQMLNTQNNPVDFTEYVNSQTQKYADVPSIANQFKELWNFKSSLFNDARNNIVNAYSMFEETTNPAFRNYMQTALTQWNKMISDIDKQRAQAESYYWPGWIAENMINDYLIKYGNSLATKTAENQALAKNTWIRSWASAAAVRAWVAAQQTLDTDNIIKFQEKKVADLSTLYNTYNNLISQLRAESSTANQAFILQPLAQMLDRQTNIAKALVDNEASLNALKLQYWLAQKSTTNTDWITTDQEKVNKIMAAYANIMWPLIWVPSGTTSS